MDLKTLLTADYLDIIFDQRNKKYGSYELRRGYNSRMKKALTLALTAITALITLSFVSVKHNREIVITGPAKTVTPAIYHPKIYQPHTVPTAHLVTPPAKRYVTPSITAAPKIVMDRSIPDTKVINKITIAVNNQKGNDTIGDPGIINGSGSGVSDSTGNSGSTAFVTTTCKEVLKWAGQMPVFAGDIDHYLSTHLRYPVYAQENDIQGPVVVSFIVNENGKVSNASIVQSTGGGCDEEALRIINSMPDWKPGRQNGIPVKVMFSLKIIFRLQSN
jgi:protein TonB